MRPLQSFLNSVRSMMSSRRRRPTLQFVESLEGRTLLAGNVAVSLADGNLLLQGDSANNSLKLTVVDSNLVVSGTDSTTINGSTAAFVLVTGGTVFNGSVIATLGAGNDGLQIDNGVTLGGELAVVDLQGTTEIGINHATIGGNIVVNAAEGADILSLEGATINGSLTFNAGSGRNLLSIADSTISQNLTFFGFRGEDDIVITGSTISGNTWLDTGDWRDSFAFIDSTFAGNLFIQAGRHNDNLQFDGVTVNGRTDLWSWLGSDSIRTQNTNAFQGDFFAGGILGKTDALEVSAASTFGGARSQPGFNSNTVDAALFTARITEGAIARAAAARARLGGTPLAELTITTDVSTNTLQTLSAETFTQQDTHTITGVTLADSTVAADLGSGTFTAASTTADANGNYTLVVPIANGSNTITVRSSDKFGRTVNAAPLTIQAIQGSIVEYTSTLGTFQVELFDEETPVTVANFLNYLPQFEDSIVHRVARIADSGVEVIQGGGAVLNGDALTGITTDPPIINEASSTRPNVRGTLAMARSTSLNSATSQWFINTVDNTALDAAANPFTVFGRVIGTGMSVVDAIFDLPVHDISNVATIPGVGLTHVPLIDFETVVEQLTGTASVELNSVNVTGTGTAFSTELAVGDVVRIGSFTSTVASITSDTELVLTSVAAAAQVDQAVFTSGASLPSPVAANYVTFSSIARILA